MPSSQQIDIPAHGHIDVISCGITFPCDAKTLDLIKQADIVFGSKILVAQCPVSVQAIRIIAAKAREDAEEVLALCRQGKAVLVLTSGDALYHGFGSTLAKLRKGQESITYHPNITAFQALFHKLGLPWHDARLFSAHGGQPLPVRCIAEALFSVCYAGTSYPAEIIAEAIIAFHPPSGKRPALIAERLGTDEERILTGSLAELSKQVFAPTSILVILPETQEILNMLVGQMQNDITSASETISASILTPTLPPTLPLGLPEDSYERENNLITASDVRAIILSRLRLPAWGTLWDIGAGSGSVGLEAAGLRPDLNVLGMEKSAKRAAMIERNVARMGVNKYTLHLGDALEYINALPRIDSAVNTTISSVDTDYFVAPDRIFIGGGGEKLPALLTACMERLRPCGIIVVSAITLESFHALSTCLPEHRVALSAINIAHEQSIAGEYHHLKNQNTIYLFTFAKEKHA